MSKKCELHDSRLQSVEQTIYGRPGEDGLLAELKCLQEAVETHSKYFNWIVGGWFVVSLAFTLHKIMAGG